MLKRAWRDKNTVIIMTSDHETDGDHGLVKPCFIIKALFAFRSFGWIPQTNILQVETGIGSQDILIPFSRELDLAIGACLEDLTKIISDGEASRRERSLSSRRPRFLCPDGIYPCGSKPFRSGLADVLLRRERGETS